jgi:hypothetical protein
MNREERKNAELKLVRYVEEVKDEFLLNHVQVFLALLEISDPKHELLAIKGYLNPKRGTKTLNLEKDWVWNEDQIKAWNQSDEKKHADRALAWVKTKFEALPGMKTKGVRLNYGTTPRDMNKQVELWDKKNPHTGPNARSLYDKALREISKASYPDTPDTEAVGRFSAFLKGAGLPEKVTQATPGLSAHGQSRAFDFTASSDKTDPPLHLRDGNPEGWRKSGCAAALADATRAYNAEKARGLRVFTPLTAPDEPWHFFYDPDLAKQARGGPAQETKAATAAGGSH